jgi:hypothetical protein
MASVLFIFHFNNELMMTLYVCCLLVALQLQIVCTLLISCIVIINYMYVAY